MRLEPNLWADPLSGGMLAPPGRERWAGAVGGSGSESGHSRKSSDCHMNDILLPEH